MSQRAYKSGSAFPELQADKIRIYSSRLCPFSERARLVLAHKNIPHDIVNVDLKDKPEWFLSRTPTGSTPVIEHNGKTLFESTAVCEYLDDSFPGEKLQPSDPWQKAEDRILLEQFGKLTSSYHYVLFNGEKKEIELQAKVNQLLKILQYYEGELIKRGALFFGGKAPAMIDYYMWPHFERMPVVAKQCSKVDLKQFPKLLEWVNVMTQVPAVKKVMFDAEWHEKVVSLIRAGNTDAPNLGLTE